MISSDVYHYKREIIEHNDDTIVINNCDQKNDLHKFKKFIDKAIEDGMKVITICPSDDDGILIAGIKKRKETDEEYSIRLKGHEKEAKECVKRSINMQVDDYKRNREIFEAGNVYFKLAVRSFHRQEKDITDEMIDIVKSLISKEDIEELIKGGSK